MGSLSATEQVSTRPRRRAPTHHTDHAFAHVEPLHMLRKTSEPTQNELFFFGVEYPKKNTMQECTRHQRHEQHAEDECGRPTKGQFEHARQRVLNNLAVAPFLLSCYRRSDDRFSHRSCRAGAGNHRRRSRRRSLHGKQGPCEAPTPSRKDQATKPGAPPQSMIISMDTGLLPRLQPSSQIHCPHCHHWHDVIAIHTTGTGYTIAMRYWECRGRRFYAGQEGATSRHEITTCRAAASSSLIQRA